MTAPWESYYYPYLIDKETEVWSNWLMLIHLVNTEQTNIQTQVVWF